MYRWTPYGLLEDTAPPVRYVETTRALIAEDLDRDGTQDLLALNGFGNLQSGFHQPTPHELVAALVSHGEPQGIDFDATASLQLTVTPSAADKRVAVVLAGADAPLSTADSYTIHPQQVAEGDAFPEVTDRRIKVVIGVSRSGDRWSVRNVVPGARGTAVYVHSDHRIRKPVLTGRNAWGGVSRFYTGDSDIDTAMQRGLDLPPFCGSYAVVSDFVFQPMVGHGADDSTVIGAMGAITADYDGDGSLDVLVLAGEWTPPATNAPLQLYRGRPSENHWLAVDLEGSRSNRMGIGAKVIVEAGGRAQTRWETGGLRGASQDGPRLHVGLGPNVIADKITVQWPSGVVQVLESVPADQVLRIVEP